MPTLRLVLGDQLSPSISSLEDVETGDVILICEVNEEATYVAHHPKKIAFLFSAMRHFAYELKEQGYSVRYICLDDPENSGTLEGEVRRALLMTGATRLVVTAPGEFRLFKAFRSWEGTLGILVEIRPDTRFACSIGEFRAWARERQQLRMEFFYREMRKKFRLLMDETGLPTGGQWNFDKENRKPPPDDFSSPPRISHQKDQTTRDVLALVKAKFSKNFGRLEPFHYAVTRSQALQELTHFIEFILPSFGDHQDAMAVGETYLYHSLLSSYLNAGLLLPLEICRLAEQAYRAQKAPLNAVEGFIRQILGWREFMRGVYWLKMPDYGDLNFFGAREPLPSFYWTGETQMACMGEVIAQTRDHAYSHHIQRLMVTGNFALIAGLDVKQVQEWYLCVYSDAYEWVEMPNTLGMALFADGGVVGSKPYAASGKYINKMSNFCRKCAYDPAETQTPTACPFNALYWDFFARNEGKLKKNQRLTYVYASWHKWDADKQKSIRDKATQIFEKMRQGTL